MDKKKYLVFNKDIMDGSDLIWKKDKEYLVTYWRDDEDVYKVSNEINGLYMIDVIEHADILKIITK